MSDGDSTISSMPQAALPLSGEAVPCAQRGTNAQAPAAAFGVPAASVSPPVPLAQFQTWIDLSTAPPTLRMYVDTNWVALYSIGSDGSVVPLQPVSLPSPAADAHAATKQYVDNRTSAVGTLVFKGVIDCTASPNYPAADAGDFYIVGAAGKIGGAAGVNAGISATLLCLTDGTASGTQLDVGVHWRVGQGNSNALVIGPSSATDGSFALFDGTSGTLIKEGNVARDVDPAMLAASDLRVPSQKAAKHAFGGGPLAGDTPQQGQFWTWDAVSSSFRVRDSEGKNLLVNSAFDIWQENTSYTITVPGNKLFIADFWKLGFNGVGPTRTVNRVAGLSGSQYALKVQRIPGGTDPSRVRLSQQFGKAESMFLAGKTVTVSFDFMVGADFTGIAPAVGMYYGTGVDEDFVETGAGPHFLTGAGFTTLGTLLTAQLAPAGTVARLVHPALAIPAGITELVCDIHVGLFSTNPAGADDSYTIGNIKMEIGRIATPHQRPNPATELRRCQRRYWKTFLRSAVPTEGAGPGTGEHRALATRAGAHMQSLGTVRFPAMRATPNVTLFNPVFGAAAGQARDLAAGDCTSTAVQNVTESCFEIAATGNAATAIGNTLGVHAVADARL